MGCGAIAQITAGYRLVVRLDLPLTLGYKVLMNANKRAVAIIELLLVAPASLFMIALFLRAVQPALRTGLVVDWFSHRLILGLYVFLISMPLAAFVVGCTLIFRSWRADVELRIATLKTLATAREHLPSLLIAAATLMAGGILAIVAMHMITG